MQGLLVGKGFVALVGAPAIVAAEARPGRLHFLAMSLCRKAREARFVPLRVQPDGSAIGAMDHKIPNRQSHRARSSCFQPILVAASVVIRMWAGRKGRPHDAATAAVGSIDHNCPRLFGQLGDQLVPTPPTGLVFPLPSHALFCRGR